MFIKAILDSILWVFASIFFGLLQLWLSIGRNWFSNITNEINTVFLNGVLLFFCSGIVISSSFDIWLEEKINKNHRWYIIFHILIPIILLIAIVHIYLTITDNKVNLNKIKYFQIGILIYSLIYSTLCKIQLGLLKLRNNL